MIWSYLKRSWLVLLLLAGSVQAEDIDIYAGVGSATGTDAPQLMFVLDTSAHFSASASSQRCSITPSGVVKTDGTGTAATFLDGQAAAMEQCALYAALSALPTATRTGAPVAMTSLPGWMPRTSPSGINNKW